MKIIKINSHGTQIQVEVADPTAPANGYAVVIVHGSDGMNEPWAAEIRGYAEALAAKGFAIFIPHYFDKTGTTPGFSSHRGAPTA